MTFVLRAIRGPGLSMAAIWHSSNGRMRSASHRKGYAVVFCSAVWNDEVAPNIDLCWPAGQQKEASRGLLRTVCMVQNGIARKPMYMQMTREQQAQPAADRATLDRHDEKLIK